MSDSSSSVSLTSSSYGKDLVKVLRVVRSESDKSHHDIAEYSIQCLLSSSPSYASRQQHSLNLSKSYTHADNSPVVATDSIKNTINYLAKTLDGPTVLTPERFSLSICHHFLKQYQHIETVEVELTQLKWSRINLQNQPGGAQGGSGDLFPHPHSFIRNGDEKRIIKAHASRSQDGKEIRLIKLTSGVKDLLLLKSSGSCFKGFLRDQFATLKEVDDRIFSTAVECHYEISLPPIPLSSLLSSASLPDFQRLYALVLWHTLRVFALDHSASVQATMFRMAQSILDDPRSKSAHRTPGNAGGNGSGNGSGNGNGNDNGWEIKDVEYSLPNKHYIPVDLAWSREKIDNLKEENAEVFLPTAHPSGLIKAKVSRSRRASSKL